MSQTNEADGNSTPRALRALNDALDELYASAPADFVRVRKKLAADLKAAGEATAAFRVADKQKPSRTEWAINQLAREEPALLKAFVHERERAAAAQSGARDPAKLRSALESYRERVSEVVRAVVKRLEQDSPAERRRIVQTLETAAADAASRQDLILGRVGPGSRDADPIAGLAADARSRPKTDEDEADERERAQAEKTARAEHAKNLTKAKKEVETLERGLEKARDAAERAAKRLETAQAEAKAAARELDQLTTQLDEAKSSLRELEEN